jgi:EAL domain-containing protein (putative c-di-GMP-specific phosphodiesterase class I)
MGALDAPAPTSGPAVAVDEALRKGWFEDWYQPKLNLKRKFLAGAEVLACIRHPRLGVLMPGDYACEPPADAVRLIESALGAALESWTSFAAAGFPLMLAVSVPLRAMLSLPIGKLVARSRPASDLWPGIVVQVKEDEIVRDLKLAGEAVRALREGRIKVGIDDFGAGYSSLATLRELPFDEIRLDRSFVRDCATGGTNRAICQTAIDLAHRLNGVAAAQGIENQSDLQAIMAMGCDFGQGNLISPALSRAKFLDLLHERVSRPARPAGASAPAPASVGVIDRIA